MFNAAKGRDMHPRLFVMKKNVIQKMQTKMCSCMFYKEEQFGLWKSFEMFVLYQMLNI